MIAPPTNGYRILIYGRDSTLLETRRLLLASSGFRVNIVSNLLEFRRSVDREQPGYELFILCHTVPDDERSVIEGVATRTDAGLYQLERMESPPRFIGRTSEMLCTFS
jgi:hypothetical protein